MIISLGYIPTIVSSVDECKMFLSDYVTSGKIINHIIFDNDIITIEQLKKAIEDLKD